MNHARKKGFRSKHTLSQVQIIEFEDLVYLPLSLHYVFEIHKNYTEKVTKHLYRKPTNDIKETVEQIKKATQKMHDGDATYFVIKDMSTQEFIGCSGMHYDTYEPKIKFWIKELAWGNSFGNATLKAMRVYARDLIEHEYLVAEVTMGNTYGNRLIQVNGGVKQIGSRGKCDQSGKLNILNRYHIPAL